MPRYHEPVDVPPPNDISWILPGRLAQGSLVTRPPSPHFDVIVLCAEEHQAPSLRIPGARILRLPLRDVEDPTRHEIKAAFQAAQYLASMLIDRHKKVLVTCRAGWNRSGLVTSGTLALLSLLELRRPASGPAVLRHIRARRKGACSNVAFNEIFEMFADELRMAHDLSKSA